MLKWSEEGRDTLQEMDSSISEERATYIVYYFLITDN